MTAAELNRLIATARAGLTSATFDEAEFNAREELIAVVFHGNAFLARRAREALSTMQALEEPEQPARKA